MDRHRCSAAHCNMFILRLPSLLLHIVYSFVFSSAAVLCGHENARTKCFVTVEAEEFDSGSSTTPFHRCENRMQVHYVDVKRQSASTAEMQSQTEPHTSRSLIRTHFSFSQCDLLHSHNSTECRSVWISPRAPPRTRKKTICNAMRQNGTQLTLNDCTLPQKQFPIVGAFARHGEKQAYKRRYSVLRYHSQNVHYFFSSASPPPRPGLSSSTLPLPPSIVIVSVARAIATNPKQLSAKCFGVYIFPFGGIFEIIAVFCAMFTGLSLSLSAISNSRCAKPEKDIEHH